MKPEVAAGTWIESDVPPRLDALGWSRWHRRIVLALGIVWVLDGLEASLDRERRARSSRTPTSSA